ncbi:DMT family transporter [Acinetobacter sp. MB5]|uniref:DMT family transporter n=1 Tax=Acinetobacter sp. MB5 TaxID=2069438 RepID=UPI000DCF97FF|nr:multidrug efflux SMR transporter [Acinetobacter sp. MB5]
MAWLVLIFAGLFEVIWAFAMKKSQGFSLLIPSVVTVIFMLLSFALLSFSMKSLPLGIAYTVWTGIGAVGSLIVGMVILQEPANALHMIAAIMIMSGLVLMRIASQ